MVNGYSSFKFYMIKFSGGKKVFFVRNFRKYFFRVYWFCVDCVFFFEIMVEGRNNKYMLLILDIELIIRNYKIEWVEWFYRGNLGYFY